MWGILEDRYMLFFVCVHAELHKQHIFRGAPWFIYTQYDHTDWRQIVVGLSKIGTPEAHETVCLYEFLTKMDDQTFFEVPRLLSLIADPV